MPHEMEEMAYNYHYNSGYQIIEIIIYKYIRR